MYVCELVYMCTICSWRLGFKFLGIGLRGDCELLVVGVGTEAGPLQEQVL